MCVCFRPSRVQSSPGPRAGSTTTAETPSGQRPVTAAALPGSGSTATSATPAAAAGGGGGQGAIQLSDLQNILSGMGVPGQGEQKEGMAFIC